MDKTCCAETSSDKAEVTHSRILLISPSFDEENPALAPVEAVIKVSMVLLI